MDERTNYEKMIDGISELAKNIGVYHRELRDQGFSIEESFSLTMQYQHELFELMRCNGGRNDATNS